jgi:hypothetical protein
MAIAWQPNRLLPDIQDSECGRFRVVPRAKSASDPAAWLLDYLRLSDDPAEAVQGKAWSHLFGSPDAAMGYAERQLRRERPRGG